jgi:hypothetical protein
MSNHDDDCLPPSSSAVRQRALCWHDEVRLSLRRALRAVAATRNGESFAVDKLRACASEIVAVVGMQVDGEDASLAPVLATLDAWGPQRVALLQELHEREHLAAENTLVETDDPTLLASGFERSIREILRALRIEERELLDEEMLDDTTIVVRWQSGG